MLAIDEAILCHLFPDVPTKYMKHNLEVTNEHGIRLKVSDGS